MSRRAVLTLWGGSMAGRFGELKVKRWIKWVRSTFGEEISTFSLWRIWEAFGAEKWHDLIHILKDSHSVPCQKNKLKEKGRRMETKLLSFRHSTMLNFIAFITVAILGVLVWEFDCLSLPPDHKLHKARNCI